MTIFVTPVLGSAFAADLQLLLFVFVAHTVKAKALRSPNSFTFSSLADVVAKQHCPDDPEVSSTGESGESLCYLYFYLYFLASCPKGLGFTNSTHADNVA